MSEIESYEDEGEGSSSTENPLGKSFNCFKFLHRTRYEGQRNSLGERHGRGRCQLPGGDVYVGNYYHGLRHGRGCYVYARSGARYDGTWRRGFRHGHGCFLYPDGTRYEGDWKRNKRSGKGIYYYQNGDVYDGAWRQDLRHGLGVYTYANSGSKYIGTWNADRMQGPGQLTHDQHSYHGIWDRNLPDGMGCYVFQTNLYMQHGVYVLLSELDQSFSAEDSSEEYSEEGSSASAAETRGDSRVSVAKGPAEPVILKPLPLRTGLVPAWRARCVLRFDRNKMPSKPESPTETSSLDSLDDDDACTCEEEIIKPCEVDSFVSSNRFTGSSEAETYGVESASSSIIKGDEGENETSSKVEVLDKLDEAEKICSPANVGQ
uniref:Radial spoke head 1 homolog n=1 Tax=Trichogramma kaykai TaxID=54128 RepID=A0ABD2WN49_9HYME